MSRRIKKEMSSVSFSMSRFYRKISTIKPSAFLVSTVVVAIAIFLFGGGLYDIIVKPLPAVYYQNKFIFLFPQLSLQFISDSIVAMTLYSVGTVGLVVIYQSTKYAYKPRQAYMMFLVGAVMLFLAYIYLEATIKLKTGQ